MTLEKYNILKAQLLAVLVSGDLANPNGAQFQNVVDECIPVLNDILKACKIHAKS